MKALRISAFVAVSMTAIFWGTDSANAGQGPIPSITLTLTPNTGPAGTAFVASGECFEDGDSACDGVIVTLLDPEGTEVDGDSLFDNSDTYAFDLTIPADGACGEYTVIAEGDENEEIIVDTSEVFTVPCEDTTTTTEPTSETTPTSAVEAAAAVRSTFTG